MGSVAVLRSSHFKGRTILTTRPAKYTVDPRKGRVSTAGISDWDEVMEMQDLLGTPVTNCVA